MTASTLSLLESLGSNKKSRRIATLLAGYMRETLTESEQDELDEWVGAHDLNMHLFEELTDERRITLALQLINEDERDYLAQSTPSTFKVGLRKGMHKGIMIGIMAGIGVWGITEFIKLLF